MLNSIVQKIEASATDLQVIMWKPSTDFTVFNFYDIFKNVFVLLNIVQFEYVSHNFELIWTFYSF